MHTTCHPPVRLHPDNPKVFLFRGSPLVLVTATEHYGAVLNRPFRFERYLADTGERGITLTRLFMLFRELQSAENPYSTCKPESTDYVAPFVRTGPGLARDGQPKYDLDRWNPEFFERLDRFLSLASDHGIVVEVVLLSNTYADAIWALNPLNPDNNLDGHPPAKWFDYMSTRHERIFKRQCAHVGEIVRRTNQFDNIIYEICNEPGGNATPDSPTMEEVDAWQTGIARVIRETEIGLPNRHLISGQASFGYHVEDESKRTGPDVFQFAESGFEMEEIDVVCSHPLSNMVYRGKYYDLGQFMRARLSLGAFQRYCLDIYPEAKPLNLDEDNAASQHRSVMGWTIHRKRAWTALFCGAHYDMIDFSIINGFETGTEESMRNLRSWFGHLARFIHGLDIVKARPTPEVLKQAPKQVVGSVLAVPGVSYEVYLADAREREEAGAGEEISGEIVVNLPSGEYFASCYSPVSGLESPAIRSSADGDIRVELPAFREDIVVRLRRTMT